MFGLTRRHFLASAGALTGSALAGLPSRRAAGGQSPARNLVIVVARGGWDVTYSLDPKPDLPLVDAPEGEIVTYADLDVFVHASRPNVTAFFDRHADVTALVRGINVRSIVHPDCTRRMLTGSAAPGKADVAAIAAVELGLSLPVPYLVLGSEAFPGPLAGITASVGLTKQIKAVLDPDDAYALPPGSVVGFSPSVEDETTIRDWVVARAERERAARGQHGYNAERIDDFVRALESGDRLRERAADFGPRGVSLSLSEQLALATTAIASELSWSVLVTDGQNWDTHGGNSLQGTYQDNLFRDVLAFVDDLASRPGRSAGNTMLDETVVVVMSEMSRTPRLNADSGKDHWPITTAMLLGGGIAGGRVYGATDELMDAVAIDLASGNLDPAGTFLEGGHLAATILAATGVDPSSHLNASPLLAAIA